MRNSPARGACKSFPCFRGGLPLPGDFHMQGVVRGDRCTHANQLMPKTANLLLFIHLPQPEVLPKRQSLRHFSAYSFVSQVISKEVLPKENESGLNRGFSG
jgi:hypothetical protein